ncbi:MAG: hypothetical protein A2X31_06390 [Elusimicrobia bacterium GWB2_63_22]|nr:MAG: hypothetical protein A2X31_06390 [Elusimicrobia bacterium GWB2_63_22]
MHILPRVLALLLCLPSLGAAAASPFDRLPGEWGGTVVSDNDCEWKVRASVKTGNVGFFGNFTYEGDCAEEPQRGDFSIKRTSRNCFNATVKVEGMPPIPMTGCADKAGNINFKTVGFSGTLKVSKSGNSLTLNVKAPQGKAEGLFKRLVKKKAGGAKPGTKPRPRQEGGGDEQNFNSEPKAAPEVLIGGY